MGNLPEIKNLVSCILYLIPASFSLLKHARAIKKIFPIIYANKHTLNFWNPVAVDSPLVSG